MLTPEERLTREGVDELEPLRFQWLIMTLLAWSLGGLSVVVVYAVYNAYRRSPDGRTVTLVSAVVGVVVVVVLWLIATSKGKQVHERFDLWRDRAIKHLDSAARFKPASYVSARYFDSSRLNSKGYNRYSGGDHLTLRDMEMSYLSVEHRYTETYYTTDAQGRSVQRQREVVIPIFKGMLIVLPAALPHAGSLILQPKQAFLKTLLLTKSYATDSVPGGLHKLTVASPELNENYSIGTSDQFVGHRVLTPTLMVSLWDFRSRFKHMPRYSYNQNQLYIMLKDISIGCGRRPGKWTAVTLGKLGQVIDDCRVSIDFLKQTAENLKPT